MLFVILLSSLTTLVISYERNFERDTYEENLQDFNGLDRLHGLYDSDSFHGFYGVDGLEGHSGREDPKVFHGHTGLDRARSFFNEWTVEVDGGEEVAELVALQLGYIYGGSIKGFPDMYRFLKYEHEKKRRTPSTHTSTLIKDRRVRWAEQLFAKSRVKRLPVSDPDQDLQRVKRLKTVHMFEDQIYEKPQLKPMFNDELWTQEWYLQDTRTARYLPRLDLNVLPVYSLGYNGRGVRVTVLDDGIEHNHTDLRDNYDPEISWDCNDGDPDPTPRYEDIMTNSHGTRCAGEIAMAANNLKCGVGVAWGASIGGVRMLDGRITDRVEAEAIAYAVDKVDVYSASWGPNDDGQTVEGPGRLAMEAFKKGVTKGRGGKGCIYVWANGNGGAHEDNCNCDGYSSSIYTVSIGSASQHGKFPWYGETCSSTLAAAYSSGAYADQKIATTDTSDSCTLKHTGTSAAAPLAAGIVALALQANPNLNWRDVQHLIAWTSDYTPLSHNPGWQRNGAGLHFDVRFGFGLLNAAKLVNAALNWTTVPKTHACRFEATPVEKEDARLFSRESVDVEITVDACAVNYLEHVEAVINVKYSRRGALEIYLTSPQGTKVQLLSQRSKDNSKAGFVNWPMTSVATWGESPAGLWTITFRDRTEEFNSGEIGSISLILHGTKEMPAHMRTDSSIEVSLEQIPDQEYIEDMDPTVLAQFEKELLRTHHRYNDMTQFGH